MLKGVAMSGAQLFRCRPLLSGGRHKLPFLFANLTARRRLRGFRELRATGLADEGWHWRIGT
jgi:hypothetical protein